MSSGDFLAKVLALNNVKSSKIRSHVADVSYLDGIGTSWINKEKERKCDIVGIIKMCEFLLINVLFWKKNDKFWQKNLKSNSNWNEKILPEPYFNGQKNRKIPIGPIF